MLKENTELLNNFKEENIKKLQNTQVKDINNSFTFTIKNSSCKTLNNYYKVTIKNELRSLVIKAENKTDETQIYSMKYSLKDLHDLKHEFISKPEDISNIYKYLQNLIFTGTKVQIMMSQKIPIEDIISLTIKLISDNTKIEFNLKKGDLNLTENLINEYEKKNLNEIDEHCNEGSDFTGKNYLPYETKDISNSVSSKDKEKEIKNNISFLGKKRNDILTSENLAEIEKENCTNEIVNEKGVKNKENDFLDLVKDLYGKSEEKLINNQSIEESNFEEIKEEGQLDKRNINDKNEEKLKKNNQNIKDPINSFPKNNINEQNTSNKENENNINNININSTSLSSSNDINLDNNNNNNKKKVIFSIQTDKLNPTINLNDKTKYPTFLVIRNGEYPDWYLHQLQMQERKRRRHGERSDEDEEEFKVYNVDSPYQENVIRISTPMKLRTKTEFIDLSEEDPYNLTVSNSIKESIFHKYNHIIENDLIKSQIVTKKEQIELLIDSIETVNNNRNIEEEEAESNTISKIHLLYQGTDDGSSAYMFHEKCDGEKNLLIIIQTDANILFGGFTKKSFDSKKVNKKTDRNSFIFNLNKLKVYKGIVGRKNGTYIEPGILSQKKFGPSFLNDAIFMGKNLLGDIGHVGEKQCGYDTMNDYEINNGDKYFRAKEVEIYKIVFNDLIFLD